MVRMAIISVLRAGKITHLSKNGVTRYLFENGNGERQEGTLEK